MAGVQCFGCGTAFGFFKREHDCKNCGMLFCSSCTASQSLVLPNQGPKRTKVCDQCFKKLQPRTKLATELSRTEKKQLNDLNRNSQTPDGNLSQTRGFPGNQFPDNIPAKKEDRNENASQDPDDEIRKRLKELRSDDSGDTAINTDDELGDKFENLTGRKATCMQKSNITTPTPKKSEMEQTEDLMKQMMEEYKIDASLADSGTTVTERQIEERLARLKDMDPRKFGKPQVPDWDSDEDEETANASYLRQVIEEAALEKKLEAMGDDSSSASNKKKQGKKNEMNFQPSIFSHEYEADEDEDELPWCCICNANAVLRCNGCDGDLYCRRCFKEGHSREDYDDHQASPYRPPRKK